MKTTEELLNEIKNSTDVNTYLEHNEGELEQVSLADYLCEMLDKYNTTRSKVFARAQMAGSNYGYEVFSHNKMPSRDKIISICCGFPLTLEETQKALCFAKAGALYPRDKRDAIIMLSIRNQYSLDKMNDILFEQGLPILE